MDGFIVRVILIFPPVGQDSVGMQEALLKVMSQP